MPVAAILDFQKFKFLPADTLGRPNLRKSAKFHQDRALLSGYVQKQPVFPEREYVAFGSLLSQILLSVVCNVGAPYSGG